MKKIAWIIGIILLIIGVYIWLSTNNILTEVQNSQYSYDTDTYINSLQNIWDIAQPIGFLGFALLIVGILFLVYEGYMVIVCKRKK